MSYWVLDLVVHRPDLPLYDNTAKVGFGLWNHPVWQARPSRRTAIIAFGVIMLGVQGYIFFGPPPASASAAASTALAAYAVFAAIIWFFADRRPTEGAA